jgi:hypothetical protein
MKSLLFISVLVFLLCSCFIRSGNEPIIFDNSDPLALAPDVSWAVIDDPYVAFRKDAGWNFDVTGHCRRSEIYRIEGCRTVITGETSEKWYLFSQGWLPASAIVVCSNKLRAQTTAQSLEL